MIEIKDEFLNEEDLIPRDLFKHPKIKSYFFIINNEAPYFRVFRREFPER